MDDEFLFLDEVDSTNSYMARHAADIVHGGVVAVRNQTAGRGQRGNTWEAEPGMNVTMSLMVRPAGMPVSEAFRLSEAVALGVCAVLESLSAGTVRVGIKWPNDIYVTDSKIAGILIENALRGDMVERSIVGIGLNLNQRRFLSNAPNPVSLWQLTGVDHDVRTVVKSVADCVMNRIERLQSASEADVLHGEYMKRLWRGAGFHAFVETATGHRFDAEVVAVAPSGHITLRMHSGATATYAFKEIAWPLL